MGWAVNRVLTGMTPVEVDPNFRYDITFAEEGAGRVPKVATEGVERGWNVEWFTSYRECLSVLPGGGYLYTGSGYIHSANNYIIRNMIMLVKYVRAIVMHTKYDQYSNTSRDACARKFKLRQNKYKS